MSLLYLADPKIKLLFNDSCQCTDEDLVVNIFCVSRWQNGLHYLEL